MTDRLIAATVASDFVVLRSQQFFGVIIIDRNDKKTQAVINWNYSLKKLIELSKSSRNCVDVMTLCLGREASFFGSSRSFPFYFSSTSSAAVLPAIHGLLLVFPVSCDFLWVY